MSIIDMILKVLIFEDKLECGMVVRFSVIPWVRFMKYLVCA